MNDCHRVRALLDVYLDDEASAETNAVVQEHAGRCASCAAALQSARTLRTALREALATDRAPDRLHARVRAALVPASSRLTTLVRTWLVPASAAAVVLLIALRGDVPDAAAVDAAVAEHVACALDRRGTTVTAGSAPASIFPWVPDPERRVRILDAHACGRDGEYRHLVVERDGTRASILITEVAGGQPSAQAPTVASGPYDVRVVSSARHVAYLIVDRDRAGVLRAWREPAAQRVQRFLHHLEGP